MIKYTARIQIAKILSITFFHLRSNIAYSWHFPLIWNSSQPFFVLYDLDILKRTGWLSLNLVLSDVFSWWESFGIYGRHTTKVRLCPREIALITIFLYDNSSCQIFCFLSSRSTMLNDTRLAIKQAQKESTHSKGRSRYWPYFQLHSLYNRKQLTLYPGHIIPTSLSVSTIMTSLSSINFSKEGRENSTWKITPHFNRSINENFDTFITKHNHFPLESS